MSLPKTLNFAGGAQTKTSAVAAVSSQYNCKPVTGQSWSPGSTICYDLGGSGSRSTWLNTAGTYVMLDVTVATNVAGTCQALGFDFIKTLTLYSAAGSQQIESVQNYAVLHGMLRDLCSDRSNITSDSIMLGADPLRSRVGKPFATDAVGTTLRFAFPLVSIIGTLGTEAYLPLFGLNAPLRLELTLNSAANAVTIVSGAASANYTVTGATLVENLISISDVAQSQIMSMTGGVFNWHSSVWRCHQTVHPAGQASDTIVIPSRCDSVRSVLTCQILSANRELVTRQSNYERIKNALATYQYRIGSSYANPVPVDCVSGNALEAYMEARRVFGSVSSESCPTLLTATDYAGDTALAPAASALGTRDSTIADHPSFIVALEAQPFSQVDKLISGTSTLASSIYLDLVFNGTVLATDVLSFVEADALFSVDANIGTCTVRF
jgi:hypothetical protein